jgi:hypothetical protein
LTGDRPTQPDIDPIAVGRLKPLRLIALCLIALHPNLAV